MERIGRTLAAAAFLVSLGLGCGGGDGGADAQVFDAPVTQGTISFSWSISDPEGTMLLCDDIAAGSVAIIATPSLGGFGQVDPFSCEAGSGTSQELDPGSYDVDFRLSGTAGTLDETATMSGVEVVANQDVDLGTVAFEVEPVGSFDFTVATGSTAGNCEDQDNDGGGLTALEIELRDDDGTCLPTTFAVDDPNDAGAPDYQNDCAGATYGCAEDDVTFTVADVPSGAHSLVITGYIDGMECYGRTSQFRIPGGNLSLSLPTQSLMLSAVPACDPNAPDMDAGVGMDAP